MADNRYVEGEPVYAERVVETTQYAPAPVAVEPVRRAHPGLIPLALSSLLGLLSLFLPFARIAQAFTRILPNGLEETLSANHTFSAWNLGGAHGTVLWPLLLTALAALVGYFTRASWGRWIAGILGLISGIWLLAHSLFRFSHAGLGNFFGANLTGTNFAQYVHSGIGRWLMALAGLALLLTALWSLLRGAGDDVADAAVGAYNNR